MEAAVELAGHALRQTIMIRSQFVLRLSAARTQISARKTRTEE